MTSREFRERLARRARKAGISVSPDQCDRLEAYYRLLARWNEKINLTALPLRTPTDAAFDRLLIESIAAARSVPDAGLTWFDLGSGGGSPAIPLKLVRPAARLTMVEAKSRKAAFLREAVRVLNLVETSVVAERFERLCGDHPEAIHSARLVTVRAVKIDSAVIDAAAKLLVPSGRFLLFGATIAADRRLSEALVYEETVKLTVGESSSLTVFIRQ